MSADDIETALDAAVTTALGALPTAKENKNFDRPAADLPYAATWFMPNKPRVVTCGANGFDEHTGIYQVDFNYAQKLGRNPVRAAVKAFCELFPAGRALSSNGQPVTIRNCGAGAGRSTDGYYRVSVTIEYLAHVQRSS